MKHGLVLRIALGLFCLQCGLLASCRKSDDAPVLRPLVERAADFDAAWDTMELGEADRALEVFEALHSEDPLDPLAQLGRGEALTRLGRWSEASVAFRQAISIDPACPGAARGLAVVTSKLGRDDEAVDWMVTALALGQVDAGEVVEHADFEALRSDHRVVFFASTGFLPRGDEELQAELLTPSVPVGGEVVVQLRLLLLNRPLLAESDRPLLNLEHQLPPGFLRPLTRVESVETGDSGERQYQIRSLDLRFRSLAAGSLVIGPFHLRLGDQELTAPALNLRLGDDGLPASQVSDDFSGELLKGFPNTPSLDQLPAADFFGFPSALGDLPPKSRMELRPLGGERYLLRAVVPWRGTGAAFSGQLRLSGLPSPMPAHGPATATMLVQRSTLGASWLRVEQELDLSGLDGLGPVILKDGKKELSKALWEF